MARVVFQDNARVAFEHRRAEGLVPDALLQHEIEPIANDGSIRSCEDAAMAKGSRAVLHSPVVPEYVVSLCNEVGNLISQVRWIGKRKPGARQRRFDVGCRKG